MSWTWEPAATALALRLLAASLDLALLALLAGGALRLARRRCSPRLAAVVWLLVMARLLAGLWIAAPLLPALRLEIGAAAPANAADAAARSGPEATSFEPSSAAEASPRAAAGPSLPSLQEVLPGLALLWLAGVGAMGITAARDRVRLHRVLTEAAPAGPVLERRLACLAARLGVRKAPPLRLTGALESPALAGTFGPVILLPAWLAEEGEAEAVDWALAHELMHLRMRDPLAGLLRQVFQTVFFFHPLAGWVGRRWEESAELACDRALVASEEEAGRYAEALFRILQAARDRQREALAAGLFATRTQIGRRIAALLHSPLATAPRLTRTGALLLALLGAAALATGTAWSAARPGGGKALLARLREITARPREHPQEVFNPQQRAAWALARARGGDLAESLLDALESEDWVEREHAGWVLAMAPDPRALEPLTANLRHPQYRVREAAAYALGPLGDRRAVEPLFAVLGDPAWQVRASAVDALSTLGAPGTAERLRPLLDDPHVAVRGAARSALEAMARPQPDS